MIRIYTDGAWRKKDNASAASAVIVWENGTIDVFHKYLGNTTNNCAELHAITLGLNNLLKIRGTEYPVKIYSDSTYAVGILTKDWKPKANIHLITKIKAIISQFRDIQFEWVKGHSKNKYNRLADLLANISIDQYLKIDTKYL